MLHLNDYTVDTILTPEIPLNLVSVGDECEGGFGSEMCSSAFQTLTYNYTPVPEPATWAMMLDGFGTLGAAKRRKQSPHVSFSQRPSTTSPAGEGGSAKKSAAGRYEALRVDPRIAGQAPTKRFGVEQL